MRAIQERIERLGMQEKFGRFWCRSKKSLK
jgi:hypothetical protein